MIKIFLIAIGGAISAILRYLISGIGYKIFGNGFAWGTLIVNLTGSFLIGFYGRFSKTVLYLQLLGYFF